jgi:hypothetical protein
LTAPKHIFEAFLHSTNTKMHHHECNTNIEPIYLIKKSKMTFSYTRFPVNIINVEKFFKIMRKLLFNYFFYSHPEIGKFQGVTPTPCQSKSIPINVSPLAPIRQDHYNIKVSNYSTKPEPYSRVVALLSWVVLHVPIKHVVL